MHDVEGVFEKVYMDIWTATYAGVTHKCLTIIDSLTRWADVIEVPSETGQDIANAMFNMWVAALEFHG